MIVELGAWIRFHLASKEKINEEKARPVLIEKVVLLRQIKNSDLLNRGIVHSLSRGHVQELQPRAVQEQVLPNRFSDDGVNVEVDALQVRPREGASIRLDQATCDRRGALSFHLFKVLVNIFFL